MNNSLSAAEYYSYHTRRFASLP